MIGLIVTGHGNFATGLTSSLKLIAGEPKNYVAVDFLESYSVDDLEREFKKWSKTLILQGLQRIFRISFENGRPVGKKAGKR